jgi:CHAT domain-containing protein
MQTSDNQNIAFDEDVSLTHSMLAMAGANTLLNRLAKLQDSPQAADQALRHAASDGILTASEIGRTDLRGMDLVVLSACQTGLGDVTQEGVMGLQRGFKKAGAQTILMSLWSVDDRATAQLMVQFYKNLLDGQTKRQAFLTAQRKLRQQYASRQNAEQLWGAFILLDALD